MFSHLLQVPHKKGQTWEKPKSRGSKHTQRTLSHQVTRTLVPFQSGADGGWTTEREPISEEQTA